MKQLLHAFKPLWLATLILTAWPPSAGMAQSTGDWRVYMKEADCAETLIDWMTVASEHPVFGLNVYSPARSPNVPFNNVFPLTPAGFALAQTRANFLRIIGIATEGELGPVASYRNYCCRVYSVWFKEEAGVTRARPGSG